MFSNEITPLKEKYGIAFTNFVQNLDVIHLPMKSPGDIFFHDIIGDNDVSRQPKSDLFFHKGNRCDDITWRRLSKAVGSFIMSCQKMTTTKHNGNVQ